MPPASLGARQTRRRAETRARSFKLLHTARLSGGAIQDNFAIDVDIRGGSMPGRHALVLRTDAPTGVTTSLSRLQEYAVLRVAFAAGLTVPEPLWASAGYDVAKNFFVMRRVPGIAIEYALDWLWRKAPDNFDIVLCHGDFRTGNYLVDHGQLTGILDWDFTSSSDPLEDIGWFCACSWRFGSWQWDAGGLAEREVFYRSYERASGHAIARDRIPYWEVMAAVRWAVIALQQAERHLTGGQQSLELALTGRMVPEMEYDMLTLIDSLEQGVV